MWGLLCEAYRQECFKARGGSLLNHAKRLPVNAYVVIAIRNVDTTLRVYVAAMWPIQSGSNSQAPITIAAAMPPGNRGDQARNDINPPDGMVLGVDD